MFGFWKNIDNYKDKIAAKKENELDNKNTNVVKEKFNTFLSALYDLYNNFIELFKLILSAPSNFATFIIFATFLSFHMHKPKNNIKYIITLLILYI